MCLCCCCPLSSGQRKRRRCRCFELCRLCVFVCRRPQKKSGQQVDSVDYQNWFSLFFLSSSSSFLCMLIVVKRASSSQSVSQSSRECLHAIQSHEKQSLTREKGPSRVRPPGPLSFNMFCQTTCYFATYSKRLAKTKCFHSLTTGDRVGQITTLFTINRKIFLKENLPKKRQIN